MSDHLSGERVPGAAGHHPIVVGQRGEKTGVEGVAGTGEVADFRDRWHRHVGNQFAAAPKACRIRTIAGRHDGIAEPNAM